MTNSSHVPSAGTVRSDAHAHGREAGGSGARPGERPEEFWERRYSEAARVWSGRVNPTLAAIVENLEPGRSLDLGSGEGGDVLWLAERGWEASGIELSRTAAARAREEAAARGLTRTRFIVADLGEWALRPAVIDVRFEPYDLVTASFLQSPVELPRERILRTAASRVAPGGLLVVISHAEPPAWAKDHPGNFPSPEQELETLALDPGRWKILVSEVRSRVAGTPEGAASEAPETELQDTVVVAQRLG